MADSIFDLIFGEDRFKPKSVSLIDGLNTLTESAFPISTGYRKFLDIPAESRANLIQPLREKVEQMPTAPYDVQRGGFQGVLGSSEAEKIDGYSGSDPTDYDISGENISNFDKLMAENILGGAELMVQPDVIGKELSDIGQGYYQKATGDITNKEQVAKAEATTEAVKGLLTSEGFNKSLYESGGALNLIGGGAYGAYKGAQLSKALYDKGIQAGMSVRKIDQPIKTSDTEPRVDPSGYYMQSEDFLINQGKENFKSPQTLASYSKKDPNKIVGLLADKGVPELEIKELGLVDFLAQKQKEGQGVTKSELLDYINENRPVVTKTTFESEAGLTNAKLLSSEDPVEAGRLFNIPEDGQQIPYAVVSNGYDDYVANNIIDKADVNEFDEFIERIDMAIKDNPYGIRVNELTGIREGISDPKYRQAILNGEADAFPEIRYFIKQGEEAIYYNNPMYEFPNQVGYTATFNSLDNSWQIKDPNGRTLDDYEIEDLGEDFNIDPYNMNRSDVNLIIRQHLFENDEDLFGDATVIDKDVYWSDYKSGNIEKDTYFEEPVFVAKKGLEKPAFTDFHTMGKGSEDVRGSDYLFHMRGGEITDQEGVRHLNIQELQSDWWQQLGKYGIDRQENYSKRKVAIDQVKKQVTDPEFKESVELRSQALDEKKKLQDFRIKENLFNMVDMIEENLDITPFNKEQVQGMKKAVGNLDKIMKEDVFDQNLNLGLFGERYDKYGFTVQFSNHALTKQRVKKLSEQDQENYKLLKDYIQTLEDKMSHNAYQLGFDADRIVSDNKSKKKLDNDFDVIQQDVVERGYQPSQTSDKFIITSNLNYKIAEIPINVKEPTVLWSEDLFKRPQSEIDRTMKELEKPINDYLDFIKKYKANVKEKEVVRQLESKLNDLERKPTGIGGTRPPLGREKGGRKKYAETGIKEAVKRAIDKGIDRVSWTTSDMQVDMGSAGARTAYKNLYDKDLVNYAKEYADKYGGKVGTVDIDFGSFRHPDRNTAVYQGVKKVHYLEITPEMKKNLTKGGDQVKQSLYSASPAVPLGILGMQEEEKGRMNPNKGLLQ